MLYNSTDNTFSGYDWDLFQKIITIFPFEYVLRVSNSWDEMMHGLSLPINDSNHCDISLSSIPYDNSALGIWGNITYPQGSFLSVPTFRDSYGVAVLVNPYTIDWWLWTRMFSGLMWMTIVFATIFIAWMVWWSEKNYHDRGMGKTYYPSGFQSGMYEAIYRVFAKLYNVVSDWNVVSIISKILSLAWGIVTVVLMANYTAALSGFLSADTSSTKITDIDQIKSGKFKIITYDSIADKVSKYFDNAPIDFFRWSSDADLTTYLDLVKIGKFDGLLMDLPSLQWVTSSDCTLKAVGNILPTDIGVGFNKYMSSDFIQQYNNVILTLQSNGYMETLSNAWLPTVFCSYLNTGPVAFINIAGLFIVIAASTGLALLLAILPHISTKFDLIEIKQKFNSHSMVVATNTFVKRVFSKRSIKVSPSMVIFHPSKSGNVSMKHVQYNDIKSTNSNDMHIEEI
jgi:hypothetical protein